MWVFGVRDMDDFHEKSRGMSLDCVPDRITVPLLVTHGEQDRQIALDYVRRSLDQPSGSADRELNIFTTREDGVEHVGADNVSFGRDYLADWFSAELGGTLS